MNIFEKLKLKSQLKNCDFQLAGTVIKQQYYQKNGGGELNRLIDEFMADPCVETALKLIDYDYLMAFYFTESKNGGLYVTKKSQTGDTTPGDYGNPDVVQKAESSPPKFVSDNSETFSFQDAATTEKIPEPELLSEIKVSKWVMPTTGKRTEEPLRRETFYSPESPPNPVIIDEETAPLPRVKFKDELPFAQRSVAAGKLETTDFPVSVPNWDEDELKPEPAFPAEEAIADAIGEKSGNKEDDVFRPTANHAVTFRYAEKEHAASSNAFDLHSVIPEKTSFPNVIATLKIDINEMKKQISIYNRRILENHPESAKYQVWIKSLEKALDEFTNAVRILSESRK